MPNRRNGSSLFIGRPDTSTNRLNTLETWMLSDPGRFAQQGALTLDVLPSVLADFGNLLAVQVYLPQAKYKTPLDRTRFFKDAIHRVSSLPGVESTAAVSALSVLVRRTVGSLPSGFVDVKAV